MIKKKRYIENTASFFVDFIQYCSIVKNSLQSYCGEEYCLQAGYVFLLPIYALEYGIGGTGN